MRTDLRLCCTLSCIASGICVLLTSFLLFTTAFTALSAVNLSLFLLIWLLPFLLISYWTVQF